MRVTRLATLLALAPALLAAPATATVPPDDAYVAGYAAAVLEREFNVSGDAVRVRDGVITVEAAALAGADREQVVAALAGIRGALRVEVVEPTPPPATPPAPPAAPPPAVTGPARRPTGAMPSGALFRPLIADPRWPHFSAAYHYYLGDPDFQDVAAVSFGESFALYRGDVPRGGQWEIGLQAGVFAVFDLNALSRDLINADYFVAGFVGYRYQNVAVLTRLFHQSSHLGDEFLLRTRLQRVNLSYESVDLKLSWEFLDAFRVYAGGGYLFDQEPSSLKPWSTQLGVEFRSPRAFFGERVRPVGGADLQNREENDWRMNLSLRAGLQFDSVQVLGRNLQLLVEYFDGHSPSGQFYNTEIQYIGLGAHFHF